MTGLETLILSNNQLTGEIPVELGSLVNLTQLTLNNNQLTGEIPAELGRLSNLTTLRLENNGLTGAIPAALGNLAKLTELTLNTNRLTGPVPLELGGLSNLETLYLDNNRLSGEFPRSWATWPNCNMRPSGATISPGPIPTPTATCPTWWAWWPSTSPPTVKNGWIAESLADASGNLFPTPGLATPH